MPSMDAAMEKLLAILAEKGSDLYLSAGSPPRMKIQGALQALGETALAPNQMVDVARYFFQNDPDLLMEFQEKRSANLAYSVPGVGRFRVNGFFQRNEVGFVVRAIRSQIPTLEELKLPDILKRLSLEKRGLILFVGATGSGKSTSLAAMIQYRNHHEAGHILTIEDPIEFLHTNAKSLVNQREVGIDAVSYEDALQNALRQAPDVILMGEIRSRETMDYAVAFAETGHLCLSTLHANNANQAIDRIINFFPADRRNQLLMDLSLNLRAIVSQRLIPTKDGKRRAAVEVLINSPRVSDLILSGNIHELKETMEKSEEYGMVTFDKALYQMVVDGEIEPEVALKYADSANNLRIRMRDILSPRGEVSTQWSVR
ncbi:PilT/PilU family type 4a pilus ATPase [Acidithiobacillus caldus]